MNRSSSRWDGSFRRERKERVDDFAVTVLFVPSWWHSGDRSWMNNPFPSLEFTEPFHEFAVVGKDKWWVVITGY